MKKIAQRMMAFLGLGMALSETTDPKNSRVTIPQAKAKAEALKKTKDLIGKDRDYLHEHHVRLFGKDYARSRRRKKMINQNVLHSDASF